MNGSDEPSDEGLEDACSPAVALLKSRMHGVGAGFANWIVHVRTWAAQSTAAFRVPWTSTAAGLHAGALTFLRILMGVIALAHRSLPCTARWRTLFGEQLLICFCCFGWEVP